MAGFEYRQAEEVRAAFERHGCRYLFLGTSGAILLGYPDTTQNVVLYALDGIEEFEDAWKRRVEVEGFPVCHIDDIIASKAAAGRQKDVSALPRLRAFREYWNANR